MNDYLVYYHFSKMETEVGGKLWIVPVACHEGLAKIHMTPDEWNLSTPEKRMELIQTRLEDAKRKLQLPPSSKGP